MVSRAESLSPDPVARLDASNLRAVADGCSVLGAGGGGDPQLGLVMALGAVQDHGPVTVVTVKELAPEALIMPCGLIGSPTVASERIWSGDEGRILREAVEVLRGERVAALMAYEIAGANGMLPVTWAARLSLPLVDADGRGRAFSELQQQSMHLAGIPASPVVVTDGRGNTLVVHAADDAWAERLARRAAASLGGVCAAALCCMTAREARGAVIEGSLSLARALGAAVEGLPARQRVAATRDALGAVVLIDGKVLEIERGTDGGFVHGSATVQGVGRDGARQVRLELQNEFLLALEDGAVRAAVPDVITVLASDTGEPMATDRLRFGERVIVLASLAPAVWLSDPGLAVVGPRAFGYDVDHVPIAAEPLDARP
ncbi:MAG: uncharacterized protein QOI62_416 [Solirubrobacteraceae bacterium]|jgi:DUF917 family protein|nr:uncharacterized protein [Solirubrobacteraceae bacterium]MEA2357156.1 uncharacterized protein [Solirubrobacteraceae bacterium]